MVQTMKPKFNPKRIGLLACVQPNDGDWSEIRCKTWDIRDKTLGERNPILCEAETCITAPTNSAAEAIPWEELYGLITNKRTQGF